MKEALELALEALGNVTEDYVKNRQYTHNKAITALKAALAQPSDHSEQHLDMVKAQPAQRPWVGLTEDEVELYWDWEDFQCGCGRSTLLEMVRHIEAKLKELNT